LVFSQGGIDISRAHHPRLVFVLCGLAVLLFGNIGRAADPIIHEITIEGNTTTDQRLIRNVSGLREGGRLTTAAISDAIRRIYGLGLFSDVVISATDDPDSTDITIELDEFPRLQGFSFDGNKKVNDEELGKLSGLREGQILSPFQTVEARRKLRSHYRNEGYYLAEVEAQTTPGDSAGFVKLVFKTRENNKVSVKEVAFEGNEKFEDEDLRGKMSNKPKGFFKSIFGGGNFNKEKYGEDQEKIIEFYHKKGYLDFVIHADTVIVAEDKKSVVIRMTVEEGPRYFFGETSFEGNELIADDRLRRLLKYKEGKVFNQQKFEESMGELYAAYMEEGYLYARISDQTKTTDSTVAIMLDISEGIPAHVRRVNIAGNTKTKDKVIRRELAIFPGQILRRSGLIRSVRNAMQLNYFANVEPDYKILPDGDVDLNFIVEEKPTNQFQVGGGYSAQDKFVGTISLGWPNLLGNGQSLNLMLDFGKRRQSYQVNFTEPWFLDTPTTVGFDLFRTSRAWDEPQIAGTRDYVEERSGLGLQLGRRLTWPDDYFRIFWNYRLENISYTEFSDAYRDSSNTDPFALNLLDWPQVTSSMSFTIVRDSRDLPEFAMHGARAVYRAEFGGGVLGGKWNYMKNTFQYSFYRPLFWKFTLAPKFKIGAIQGTADISGLPHSERFYAGGVQSDGIIRGYDDGTIYATIPQEPRDVGPIDFTISGPGNLSVRGRGMVTMNLEITAPLVAQQIYGILFYDAGNVWANPTQMQPFSDMYSSIGFGLRISIPGMGMMGFDFGWPYRGREKGKVKPHFQFGSSF
jgi:outer membrane protein insertion porin family